MPIIKHVFFDLDHTLWDFDKNSALAFQKTFKINRLSVDCNQFLEAYIPINFEYWKRYREERVTKTALRYGRLKDSFNAINVKVEDDLIHKLSEDYITHLTTFNSLFSGTFEILNYLQPKYHLHIITNGFAEAQDKKLTNSNIKHYFKTITNSEMVGVKKPNPKIFKFALQNAKALATESVMIGDNLEADVIGAAQVGMQAILFNYNNTYNQNTYKSVNKLIELKQIL